MAKLRAYGMVAKNTIGEIVRQKAGDKIYPRLVEKAEVVAQNISRVERSGALGFYSVTGNLYSSIGITVLRHDTKGKYVLSRTFSPYAIRGGEPTRRPLNKFEKYNLGYYYSGMEVTGKPYKAMEKGGKRRGPENALEYRKALSSAKTGGHRKWLAVYLYVTMPYTKSVDAKIDGSMSEMLARLLKNQFGKQ